MNPQTKSAADVADLLRRMNTAGETDGDGNCRWCGYHTVGPYPADHGGECPIYLIHEARDQMTTRERRIDELERRAEQAEAQLREAKTKAIEQQDESDALADLQRKMEELTEEPDPKE